MTVSIEDKINLFKRVIFKEIEETAAQKKLKSMESFEREKRRLLVEVEAEKSCIMEEAVKKADKEKQRLVSRTESEIHRQMLEKKQQYIREITELLMEEAKSFTAGKDYEDYLSRCIEKARTAFEGSSSVSFYFTKRDLQVLTGHINQFLENSGFSGRCRIMMTERNILGGFYAEDDKGEVQVDYTLRTLIEENHELIGSYVLQRLEEVQNNG